MRVAASAKIFYRLNVVALRMPALRERPSDIPELAEHFLHKQYVSGSVPYCYALAHRLGLPSWPATHWRSPQLSTAVTGCLHEDGLADTANSFGGGDTTERKLDIMRDSRIAALASVRSRFRSCFAPARWPRRAGNGGGGLIAAHAGSATMPVVMFFVPPARRDGLSYAAGQPSAARVAVAAVLAIIILGFCLGPLLAVVAIVLLAIVIALMAGLSERQIGGQTGDVDGDRANQRDRYPAGGAAVVFTRRARVG